MALTFELGFLKLKTSNTTLNEELTHSMELVSKLRTLVIADERHMPAESSSGQRPPQKFLSAVGILGDLGICHSSLASGAFRPVDPGK